MLMFREPERFSGRRLAVDATVAILAFAYSFWMIYGAGQEYIAQGFLLLMAGIPVYVYLKWRQSKDAAAGTPWSPAAGRSSMRRARPSRRPGGDRHVRPRPPAGGRPRGGHRRAPSASTPRSESCARVLVHRPGLELERLTPRNKDDLLFDDVLWVKRARQEHDAFADALAERGVEVLEVRHLLAETLEQPDARTTCSTARSPRPGSARASARALREWLARAAGRRARRAPDRRHRLRRAAVPQRTSLSALAGADDFVLAPLPEPPVHARHLGLGLRRRLRQPHGQARPRARGAAPRRDLPPPPAASPAARFTFWSEGTADDPLARGRRRARHRQRLRARRHGRAHPPGGRRAARAIGSSRPAPRDARDRARPAASAARRCTSTPS